MKDSTIQEVKQSLHKALNRLDLDDIDENDTEKALTHIEDAKNQLE